MGGQSCHYFVTSLACHIFSNFVVSLSLICHDFFVTRMSLSLVCHDFFVTRMSLSLPCHIFSKSRVSLSHVTPVTWLSLVCHDQFVTVHASLSQILLINPGLINPEESSVFANGHNISPYRMRAKNVHFSQESKINFKRQ